MRVDSGKTRKTRKKILSFVISLAILLTMMVAGSGTALAEAAVFDEGDGSPGSPFQITNEAQLNAVRGDLSAHYALANDIDLTIYLSEGGDSYNDGTGWLPIGDWINMFSGTFDGNGHTINGLAINRETDCNGLFGIIGPSGVIRNLGLTGVSVESSSVNNGSLAGCNYGIIDNCSAAGTVSGVGITGGLVGYSGIYDDGYTTAGIGDIINSYAAVTVTGNEDDTGGLVGEVNNCDITDSYATGSVSGRSNSGGLVGNLIDGSINGCHATGNVTATVIYVDGNLTSGVSAGGLVGESAGSITSSYSTGDVSGGLAVGGLVGKGGSIANSYATGAVTGTISRVGGLVGYFGVGNISQCYAAGAVTGPSDVGGLVGYNGGDLISSFYAETTGQVDTGKGVCKTVIEMKQQATFTGWDFTAATGKWRILEGYTYPVLQWQPLTTEDINNMISLDKAALVITYATGDSSAGVKKNLTLPTDGAHGTAISWSSSNTAVVANDGTVTRPSGGNSAVTLTATVSFIGGTDQTRDFELTVIESVSFAGGDGSLGSPFQITNATQLNSVREDLFANYALANDIDLATYLSEGGVGYNDGAGWLPIGDCDNMYSGTFDGAGHTINGLAINRETSYNGLFGVIGSTGVIRNLGLTGVNVESSAGYNGSLVGSNLGIIDNCSAVGSVSGGDFTGGLVGLTGVYDDGNTIVGVGDITNSHAAVTVTGGGNETGGLVGEVNNCDITDSYATGSVTGRSYSGGLVGKLIEGSINGCHATGNVTATVIYVDGNLTSGVSVGGLVGQSEGSITSSYSTGNVSGGAEVGGLVGIQYDSISNSYATGAVTGISNVGGLLGYCFEDISQCYAVGAVTGDSCVGGLVGNDGGVNISSSFYAETTGQTDTGKGVYKTTIEMKQQATYTDWSFTAATGMWRIIEGHTYPVLQWQPLTTEEINAMISMDKEALVITYASGDSSAGVTQHLTLPTDGAYGSTISWSSSNTAVVANDGAVTRPSVGDSTVTLTATVGLTGGTNQTKDFSLTVIESVSFAGGDGSLGSPFQITNATQLNAVREDLSANYALANDIDLVTYLSEGGVGYNAGAGWLPIGDWDNMFSGTFDGNGHTINGLAIKNEIDYNGLFGVIAPTGVVRNLGLTDVSVESSSGYNGSLAGSNYGIIDNCSAAGAVSGLGSTGGLAGSSGMYDSDNGVGSGDITNSYAAVTVTGNGDFTGGLVGEVYDCDITDSYATGIVSGRSCSGGLVGKLWVGGISGCHATGDVTSAVINENDGSFTSGLWVGGLVGQSLGSITSSYSTGDVSGGEKIGGLVGEGGNIANSYATGAVTGTKSYVGGLMGYFSGGEISKCYAAGVVTGYSDVGGLVGVLKGVNNSVEVINSFYAETTGQVDTGKGVCKTVIEMRQQATYTTGWDFTAATGLWRIIEGHTYPVLQWQPLTTEEINAMISMDKEALVITYTSGDSSAGVTQHLTLPTDGAHGTTISWSSSNTAVVANDGTVTRPSSGNSTVTLTATVSLTGGANQTRDFELTVIDRPAVSISANPAAGGTAAGGGSYNIGATVTVTATPKSGYTFANWTEDGSEVSTDASYIFTLGTSDRTLVANFILTPPDVTKGTISGMVTDGANPVQGANVSLTVSGSVYSAATIADGSYSIPNVPIGTGYTVTAAKSGYTSGNATNVSVTANTTTQNVNITLTSDEDGCLVTYKGAQKRYNEDTNTYDIRFIAITNTLDLKEVGFVFSKTQETPTRENAAVKATTTVYTSITAAGSTVKAGDMKGTYIIVCTVTGIPVSDIDVPLHVRAFSTSGTVTKYTPVTTVTINSLP